jgi:transcriptional regulator with XRE-family HTH domain
MTDGSLATSITKDQLWQDYFACLTSALSSMRKIFKLRSALGLTQDKIAELLQIDKSLVSRRLKGEENFTLKTLSFMATAMKCRLMIQFKPYEEIGDGNNYSLELDISRDNSRVKALNPQDVRRTGLMPPPAPLAP